MVKQGYKETEIGVIPEDWRVEAFANVGDFYKGCGISMKDVKPSGFPCIMYGDIYVKFDTHFNKCDYHIDFDIAQKSARAQNGDVFFTASGETAEDIGRCVTYQGYEDIYIGGDIIAIHPFSDYSGLYLSYVQNSNSLKKQKASYAQGHSVVHINSENIKKLLFACPSLPEQIRISEALLDVDSMISSLEKLIAKKKAIKQSAMQELLTGIKRIKEFSDGEWKQVSLKEIISDFIVPMRDKPKQLNGPIPWCRIEDFDGKYLNTSKSNQGVTYETVKNMNLKIFPKGTLLVSCSAYLGRCAIVKTELITNQTFIGLVPNGKICVEFLFYIMCREEKNLNALSSGTTINYLSREQFEDYTIFIPTNVQEQIAIAEILSDIDNEIETLEQKLAKICQVKQGMMQQLLTGKIRLLTEEKSTVAIPASEPTDLSHSKSGHNQQFDDAVMIAAIVNAFYSDKYPLGRKKVQKLLYLLRRKQEEDISAFKKKAAGPYADEVRYKGGEPIAKKQGYIVTSSTQKGTVFSKGKKIDTALSYVDKWQMQSYIDWLTSTFKYTKTNDLELYATIDMAICDLQHEGIAVSVDSVKDLIRSNKEWKEKLTKTYFSDADIARAIAMRKRLYS